MTNYDSDDEAQLQRAIALSLQTPSSPTDAQPAELIDLVSDDDDDDDLDRASRAKYHTSASGGDKTKPQNSGERLALPDRTISWGDESKGASFITGNRKVETMSGMTNSNNGVSEPSPSAVSGSTPSSQSVRGLAGLDRKKMEEERLLRLQKKRVRDISPPNLRDMKRAKLPTPSTSSQSEDSGRKPDVKTTVRTNLSHKVSSLKTQDESFLQASSLLESRPNKSSDLFTPIPAVYGSSSSSGRKNLFLIPAKLMQSKPVALREVMSKQARSESSHAATEHGGIVAEVASYEQHSAVLASNIQFPDGAVKKTWAYGYPRFDDIKIEEVLQKNDLDLAILSAFQWDEEWILSKLDMRKTRVICVVQAKTEEEKRIMRANVPPNIQFCFPSMEGQIHCMHSKLQMLSHPSHLRIVIPSANLVPYDWGESGGVMENIVFLIDLPRWPDGHSSTPEELTPFGRQLRYFLKAMGMTQSVLDSMLKFDFSRTTPFAFVHTIGGSHSGDEWKLTGYCGLSSAIRELGLARKEPIQVDYVTASVGFLNYEFLKSIYLAAKGIEEYSTSTSVNQEELERNFRIYFPSKETVTKSKGGRGCGGTICFQSKWYDSPNFPREVMRDCKSQRPGMLMHNKMLFVRPSGLKPFLGDDGAPNAAWAYIGSANLSESAWGRLVKDRSSKLPKLNCRNWECGVIVPVSLLESASESASTAVSLATESVPMDVFGGVVSVPMIVPGERYGNKRPWFYLEDK